MKTQCEQHTTPRKMMFGFSDTLFFCDGIIDSRSCDAYGKVYVSFRGRTTSVKLVVTFSTIPSKLTIIDNEVQPLLHDDLLDLIEDESSDVKFG